MKLERNRAERRSKNGAQILFKGIPYLIFAALAAGFLLGTPQMIAASSISQAAKSTVTVTERRAFPFAFAGYLGKTNSVISRGFTQEDFTYTGAFTWIDDGNGDWRFKALSSGTFTPLKKIIIDVFMVGGGGAGKGTPDNTYISGAGGAGGYTGTWLNITLNANQAYPIVIGAGGLGVLGGAGNNGGSTSGFEHSVLGGYGATGTAGANGGTGGGAACYSPSYSGGAGGTNGGNGLSSYTVSGGTGQNTTTKEFGEIDGYVYAGGGGGARHGQGGSAGVGGLNGGGAGGDAAYGSGRSATANTGGGGGGGAGSYDGARYGGNGGSGILIIRNKR